MSRRVDLESDPWNDGQEHSPGRISRYTFSRVDGRIGVLETQTYGNTYRRQLFFLRNLKYTLVEKGHDGFCVILEMMRQENSLKLLFESQKEAEECHKYIFVHIQR